MLESGKYGIALHTISTERGSLSILDVALEAVLPGEELVLLETNEWSGTGVKFTKEGY